MAASYKVYQLDYVTFFAELADPLFAALDQDRVDNLIAFIEANLLLLKDPYEGLPLDQNWQEAFSPQAVHDYGNFALTKYYNPAEYGLVKIWTELDEASLDALESEEDIFLPLLGEPFGPKHNLFDPGTIGSYFQSPNAVKENLMIIQSLLNDHSDLYEQYHDEWDCILSVFHTSQKTGSGLYVTF